PVVTLFQLVDVPTLTGALWLVVLPTPSWPLTLLPQQNRA
ncbi:MAG: hypothetical protein QOD39_413, partial [Mycobacterium sp.]|nr:hypothetical protein [Mycobacterium sp.]